MGSRKYKKIPPGVLLHAGQKLDELTDILKPYLAALTPPERQGLAKIGSESIDFIKMSNGYADRNSGLFPGFGKDSALGESFFTANELWLILGKIDGLKNSISDTNMLAGNHALETATAFYNTVRIAARHDIPGARVVYEDLKPAFRSMKRRPKKTAEDVDAKQPGLFDNDDF